MRRVTGQPVSLCLDAGEFSFDPGLTEIINCGKPCNHDLLVLRSHDGTISIAGEADELNHLAMIILDTVVRYEVAREQEQK